MKGICNIQYKMLLLGQFAAARGDFSKADRMFDSAIGDLTFRVYHENGVVMNIHPVGHGAGI